ncbi:MAG: MarR family transcriptional regulator [Thermodesulfobacteriota bacterium]
MADNLGKTIDQLWFRVQLFIETTGEQERFGQLTEREFILLDYLDKKKEASFSELSAFFKKVSRSTMSGILKRFHQKKLVSRREDPRDLRSNVFSVTAKGRRMLEPVRQRQAEISHVIADSLQLTPEGTRTLTEAIMRVNRTFDQWMALSGVSETGESDKDGGLRN